MLTLNSTVYWLVCIFFALFIMGLQIFLSSRKKQILGYILPLLSVLTAIYELFTRFDRTDYLNLVDLFFAWMKIFLLYNIPTFVLLAVLLIVRLIKMRSNH